MGLPWPVAIGFALFALVIVAIVASALTPRDVPVFVPTRSRARTVPAGVTDTVTIDARDVAQWRFFDFATGRVMTPPDTQGWDIAVRRFRIITAGEVADLGGVPFDSVTVAPVEGYRSTEWGPDTVNAALERWYRYGFFSHTLRSRRHVYVLPMSQGGWARFELLAYYCPGPEPACVTLRYAVLPSGSEGSDRRGEQVRP